MSNEGFPFLNNKNIDQRYHKIWIAAVNPKEFQRLLRFENCELVPVPAICDDIASKLNEEANRLLTTELGVQKSVPSFFVASQLFIGLVYVHEQQVKFLYDLASRYTLPTRFLLENQEDANLTELDSEEELNNNSPNHPPSKKSVKRKSSAKVRRNIKRKIPLVIDIDTPDDPEDVETQNLKTLELLQTAVVANNADISLRESIDTSATNEVDDEPTCFHDMSEDNVPEPNSALLEDGLMAMTLNQSQSTDDGDVGLPTNMRESMRIRNSEIGFNDTVCGQAINDEVTETGAPDDFVAMDVSSPHHSVIDPTEMDVIIGEITAAENINISSRKRKRNRRKQPFKDLTSNINVKENVVTASTTQRQLTSKDDSVSKTSCLNNLSRKLFDQPSHSAFTTTMTRQFESRSISGKLLQSFKRMTLTKTEETNRDLVQEFFTDLQLDHELPGVETSIVTVDIPRVIPLQIAEFSVDGCNSLSDASMSPDEQISTPTIDEPPTIYQHESVELSPAIRQILLANKTLHPLLPCDTDSQQLFASRSRQNKLEWGVEGVLQKLMSLWNSGIYPVGMNEIMQSNSHRISAATAFFSVMELNSARIGLINITKSSNSNVIFDIVKSPKLIELLQQTI